MKLLIISHTPHYRGIGGVAGWAPTIREIDALATIYTHVVHIAPLYEDAAPSSALPYTAGNITHVPVIPAGGDGLKRKMHILLAYPAYAARMLREMVECDVIHVRFPANISLLALLLLYFRRRPQDRWFKYAGNWHGGVHEPWSYRLQRLLLSTHLHGGIVTVNVPEDEVHDHIRVFRNPSFSTPECRMAVSTASRKVLSYPLRLVFCGRVEAQKGVFILCQTAALLRDHGIDFRLDIIGDGDDRMACQSRIAANELDDSIVMHGWLPPLSVQTYYETAHLIVLPSSASEGWPKVLSEAMAYGVVPIASAVSSIPTLLKSFNCGTIVHTNEPSDYAAAVVSYLGHQPKWEREKAAGMIAALEFTYERHIANVQALFDGE